MSNAAATRNVSGPGTAQHMGAGKFFGAIHGKHEQCGAIFTDVRHASPRKLPMHLHELSVVAASGFPSRGPGSSCNLQLRTPNLQNPSHLDFP